MKKRKLLLETRNLCKEYGQDKAKSIALNNVDLSIYENELLVILGSSGSGKSTLLNMIGGMDYPTSGEVLFNGEDITKYNDDELTEYRKNNIGFIFQSFNLLQELTAKENVEMCLKTKDDDLINEVFKIVKLENKQDKYPRELSGGEQQRTSIARALVKDASILLCDEPTGALDYETGKSILVRLESLVRKYHKTVVIVTHTKEIAKMANRVINMRNGKITSVEINKTIKKAIDIEW